MRPPKPRLLYSQPLQSRYFNQPPLRKGATPTAGPVTGPAYNPDLPAVSPPDLNPCNSSGTLSNPAPLRHPTPAPQPPSQRETDRAHVIQDDLGKIVSANVRVLHRIGWRRLLKKLRPRGDLRIHPQLGHPAQALLTRLSMEGAPAIVSTPPWTPATIDARIQRGSHQSCYDHLDFLRAELLEFSHKGFWLVLPYQELKALMEAGELLGFRVSPMGVVPQRNRRPRIIVDLSFYDVNQDTLSLAPSEAMQFGRALERILYKIRHSNPRFGPVYLAKVDLADGFYRVGLNPSAIPKLAVALPQFPGEDQLIALPLVLPMGWIESPPYFCAATETVADLANNWPAHVPPPPHPLESVANTPPADDPGIVLTSLPSATPSTLPLASTLPSTSGPPRGVLTTQPSAPPPSLVAPALLPSAHPYSSLAVGASTLLPSTSQPPDVAMTALPSTTPSPGVMTCLPSAPGGVPVASTSRPSAMECPGVMTTLPSAPQGLPPDPPLLVPTPGVTTTQPSAPRGPPPDLPTPALRPYSKPVRHTDIYVDDFILAVQGNSHARLRHLRRLLHAIDLVFRPLDSQDPPARTHIPSLKKLLQGDAYLSTRKIVLGWLLDTIRQTLSLPPHRLERLQHLFAQLRGKTRVSVKLWHKTLGELRSMALGIPGSRGLFSLLQEGLRHTDKYRIRITPAMRDMLSDFEHLSNTLAERPTELSELVPDHPIALGPHDASGQGMGGVWLPATTHSNLPPLLWRARFPPHIQARLVSRSNPQGDITNSDLELAGLLAQQDIIAQAVNCRGRTIVPLGDNIPMVVWHHKDSTTTTGPAAYLLRLNSIHQRHFRYVSKADYIPGPANQMADDCSRLWYLTDSQLLAHFNVTYPQAQPWQIAHLRPVMLSSLISALLRQRPDLDSLLNEPPTKTPIGPCGKPLLASSAWTPTSPQSPHIDTSLYSKFLPREYGEAHSQVAGNLSELDVFRTTYGPWPRRSNWGPRTV